MFQRDRSEQGAVTVFLIVILAAVFAFVAIFIDFARMFALQAKTEALAHAASRSVLSAYDRELAEQYGLFAFGETDGNYIMSKVLQDQFELVRKSEGLPLLGARLDSSSVEMLRPIGTYAVFERQIREQMKYRAPIDVTIEIYNRFKPVAQVMKEASNAVDLLGKLQKLYDRREAKLDELLAKQRQAARLVASFSAQLPRDKRGWIGDESLGGHFTSLADAARKYADFVFKTEWDMSRPPEARKYSKQRGEYRSETEEVYTRLKRNSRGSEQQHAALLAEARELLDEVRQINEQMRRTIEEAERRPAQSGYNDVSAGPSTRDGIPQIGNSGKIANTRAKAKSLLLSEGLIADLAGDIDRQVAAFRALYADVESLKAKERAILSASARVEWFKSTVMRASRECDVYMRQFVDPGADNLLEANARQFEGHRSYDKERKAAEQAADAKLKEAAGLMAQIAALKGHLKEQQTKFDRLAADYEANRTLNRSGSGKEATTGTVALDGDSYQAGSAAMDRMDGLYGGLAGFMDGMTDNLFQTEYIVSYYNFLDVSTLNGLFQGSGAADKWESLRTQMTPERQEVEYILYGFHNPTGNIAAAYGEIFMMRMAIRTMEGLIKNAAKGNPLLILASALLYGAQHALQDMIALTREGKIQLSEYLKVDLTYRDHLRLFLLLHGRSENRLSRMLAVITMNTGIDTSERATYVKGRVTAAMPLWFLPGVVKALGAAGVLKGNVEGNRYYAAKQADFSY